MKAKYSKKTEESDQHPTEFTLKFTGTSELDVNLVIESLKTVSTSLKAINKTYNETDIQVNIKPFKEGSYDIVFSIASIVSDASLTAAGTLIFNSLPGSGVIEKFKNMVDFAVLLGGKKVEEVTKQNEEYVIETEGGDSQIVSGEVMGDVMLNKGVINNIQNLVLIFANKEEINDMKFFNQNLNEMLSIPKNELKKSAEKIEQRKQEDKINQKISSVLSNIGIIEEDKLIFKKNAIILVGKPDLMGTTLWKVVYEGNPIKIKITDTKFNTALKNREYWFTSGTPCLVDLEIKQVYDTELSAYKNKSYSLVKFHKTIDFPEQTNLFEDGGATPRLT